MQGYTDRYAGLAHGRLHRKATFDDDLEPGELDRAIARAKSGCDEALRYLFLRFADNVYGYARSIVLDEHEAEDVTQQVFARVLTAIGSYEQREVPFSAWVLRIARNTAIDHLRRRRASPVAEVRFANERDDGEREWLSRSLRDALADLPESQREVVVMRHVLGWSPAEIADALGRSEDSVHALHYRGRRALRDTLAEMGAAPAAVAA